MTFKKFIIGGCLIGASFFVACQEQAKDNTNETAAVKQEATEPSESEEKVLDVNEPSELALLMRSMYDKNLALKEQIKNGEIPESFPEDWLSIHSAESAEQLNETFDGLAKEYIKNMEAITKASTKEEGIQAYNNMISTCASCHTIYCQGPLAKIKKMKIKDFESKS
ncbi:MAG: hypothetical protein NXI09_04280 [Bacteroidetes bacterium]|nr:hypothetical protein [Bacteroidota bacterium]